MVIVRRAPKGGEPPHRGGFPFMKMIIFLVILASLAAIIVKIGKQVFRLEDEEKELDKQLDRYDNAEQYTLLADRNGLFNCCKCTVKKVYLLKGEVWKYGSTLKRFRYSKRFLAEMDLEYIVEFEGDLTACRKEEFTKIRMYKFSFENIKRNPNDRLIRPPGNCKNY